MDTTETKVWCSLWWGWGRGALGGREYEVLNGKWKNYSKNKLLKKRH